MNKKSIYDQLLEDPEYEHLMAQEDFIMEVTEAFCDILERENVKRSKLAEMLGKTKGYVSQILGGSRNLTLRTMADIALTLGYEINVKLVKKTRKNRNDTFTIPWDVGRKKALSIGNCSAPDDYYPACQQLPRIAV